MANQKKGFRKVNDDSGISVPSRSLTVTYLMDSARPVSFDEICAHFGLKKKDEKAAYYDRLDRMVGRAMLHQDRKKRYSLPSKMNLVVGTVLGHAKGFGFVVPDDGSEDLYLHPNQMRRVLHNDKVLAVTSRIDSRGRKEGKIVEAVVDLDREILGHYFEEGGVHFVDADDARYGREIVINADKTAGATSGDVVALKITQHPIEHGHVVGEIFEVLGKHMEPGMETDIAIRKYELPHRWNKEIDAQLQEMKGVLSKVNYATETDPARKDIRSLPLVTIDGADARDFDDAVYAETTANGWRLIVAIADVSYYVQPNSALDEEAYSRGTSVYFPNRVIPMLPEALSNGICSLNPDEDRNCMVCDMQFALDGELTSYTFYPAVMFSHGRLTYDEMAEIVVDKDAKLRKKRGDLCADLDNLYEFYKALVAQRKKRRTIDFDFPEPLFTFNDQQKIEKVSRRERNDAHRIIEECMLAANVCAAKFIESKSKKGGIYRVHEGPDEERLTDLRAFLSGFGLKLGGGDEPTAEHYADVLDALDDQPDLAPLIQIVLLRSLKQAVYSADPVGHFALNYDQYTHFTSPIRRYTDLVVHRLIRQIVGAEGSDFIGPKGESLPAIGEHASSTARRADEASRDVSQWLKAEFMQAYIGDEFDGRISGVQEFGIFVELQEFFVDGLVHVTMLGNDYFQYDPKHFLMTGERTGLKFRLGDPVRVKVLRADIDTGKIDFELISANGKEVKVSGDKGGAPRKGKKPFKGKGKGHQKPKFEKAKPKKPHANKPKASKPKAKKPKAHQGKPKRAEPKAKVSDAKPKKKESIWARAKKKILK
ncbi:MAG: ribonuclease R [Arenicellales bacterium]